MPSAPKEQPTATYHSLHDILKWLTDTNLQIRGSRLDQSAMYQWRRSALDDVVEPWKNETDLAGRQRFEREIAVVQHRLAGREITRVEDLPTVATMLAWMRPQRGQFYDVARDQVHQRSLAKAPAARITHRSALLHGTTKAEWEAERAVDRLT